MTHFYWELPTRGDSRHAGAPPDRVGFTALDQIISAAEVAGYDGIIAPYDPQGEESWIVAANALRRTRHARIGVEFHPGFGTPVYAAKVSATLQRFSADRLEWHLVVETTEDDDRSRGDRTDTAAKYRRADEFLSVAKGVWTGGGARGGGFAGGDFNMAGEFYDVIDGGLDTVIAGHPFPAIYLSGNSQAALELSARHGDVHLFGLSDAVDGRPLAELAERAAGTGRVVTPGLRLPIIARETSDEAWSRLERLWSVVARAQKLGPAESLRTDETTFTGFDRLGQRTDTGLVGSYEDVAAWLSSLADNGIGVVVLSGIPHIEEIHRGAEHLLYRVDRDARIPAGAPA